MEEFIVRNYISKSEIEVGDIVQTFTGAFGASIITKIEFRHLDDIDEDLIHFERPMMKIDLTGGVWMHTEKFAASRLSVFKHSKVFVTGSSLKKENRRSSF